MTKRELAKQISNRTGLGIENSEKMVDAYSTVVKETLIKGEHIEIRGFGVFKGVLRKEKTARNISQGTLLKVPAHIKPVFTPSKKHFKI